jgi:hypothetical protein
MPASPRSPARSKGTFGFRDLSLRLCPVGHPLTAFGALLEAVSPQSLASSKRSLGAFRLDHLLHAPVCKRQNRENGAVMVWGFPPGIASDGQMTT